VVDSFVLSFFKLSFHNVYSYMHLQYLLNLFLRIWMTLLVSGWPESSPEQTSSTNLLHSPQWMAILDLKSEIKKKSIWQAHIGICNNCLSGSNFTKFTIQVCYDSNMTGVTSGEGTAHPSGAHDFTPSFGVVYCISLFVLSWVGVWKP
jgi:hypothetical protein